jgi:hypothetical protein
MFGTVKISIQGISTTISMVQSGTYCTSKILTNSMVFLLFLVFLLVFFLVFLIFLVFWSFSFFEFPFCNLFSHVVHSKRVVYTPYSVCPPVQLFLILYTLLHLNCLDFNYYSIFCLIIFWFIIFLITFCS